MKQKIRKGTLAAVTRNESGTATRFEITAIGVTMLK